MMRKNMDAEQFVVRVIHTFNATSSNQITIHKGELLTVLERDNSGWWIGRTASGSCGIFPSTYVQRESSEPPPDDVAASVAKERLLRSMTLSVLEPVLRGTMRRPILPSTHATAGKGAPYIDDLFSMDERELEDEIRELNNAIDTATASATCTFDRAVDRSNEVEADSRRTTVRQQLIITKKRREAVAKEVEDAREDYEVSVANLREAGLGLPACLTAAQATHGMSNSSRNPAPKKVKATRPAARVAAKQAPESTPSAAWLEKSSGDAPTARYLEQLDGKWKQVNSAIDELEAQKAQMVKQIAALERDVVVAGEVPIDGDAKPGSPSANRRAEKKLIKAREEAEELRGSIATVQSETEALRKASVDGAQRYEELVLQFEKLNSQTQSCTSEIEAALAAKASAQERVAQLDEEIAKKVQEAVDVKANAAKARAAEVQEYRALEKERRVVYNELQEMRGNLRVYCRLRPRGQGAKAFVVPVDDITLAVTDPTTDQRSEYEFDVVLPEQATQEQVFAEVHPLVASVLDGYNICVFAYGQTGSGKTHTMEGTESDRGLSFRTLTELFSLANERRADGYDATFQLSVLEIYNDKIYDLLDGRKATSARWGGKDVGVVVQPLKLSVVQSVDEVQSLLKEAYKNRSVAGTDCNQHSSRSHCILSIYVTSVNASARSKFQAKLHLIDLAGSERVKNSGVEGVRLTEAKHINSSLSYLKSVIQALASNKVDGHVPFRNSALTSLLQDSLGGNCKCLMFANVNVTESNVPESVCTLKYAGEARRVEVGKVTSRATAM